MSAGAGVPRAARAALGPRARVVPRVRARRRAALPRVARPAASPRPRARRGASARCAGELLAPRARLATRYLSARLLGRGAGCSSGYELSPPFPLFLPLSLSPSLPLSRYLACALNPPTGGTFRRPRRRPCPLRHTPPRRPLRPPRGRGTLGAPHAAPPLPRLTRRPRGAARGAARVSGPPRSRHACEAGASPPTSPRACTVAWGAARGGRFPRADRNPARLHHSGLCTLKLVQRPPRAFPASDID